MSPLPDPLGGVTANLCRPDRSDWLCHLRCLSAWQAPGWLACRVLLKIVYLLTCRVLGLAVLVFRSDRAKDAELLAVLRHENAVLRRNVGPVWDEPGDRVGPSPRWHGCCRARVLGRSLPRDARDAAGLAPQAGLAGVRHEQAAQAWPPTVPGVALCWSRTRLPA